MEFAIHKYMVLYNAAYCQVDLEKSDDDCFFADIEYKDSCAIVLVDGFLAILTPSGIVMPSFEIRWEVAARKGRGRERRRVVIWPEEEHCVKQLKLFIRAFAQKRPTFTKDDISRALPRGDQLCVDDALEELVEEGVLTRRGRLYRSA